jgi:hypothetical protein
MPKYIIPQDMSLILYLHGNLGFRIIVDSGKDLLRGAMHIKIAQLHSKRGELGPEREFYKAPVGCGLITKAPSHIRFAV